MDYPAENVWISDVTVFVKLHRCGVEGALVSRDLDPVHVIRHNFYNSFFTLKRNKSFPRHLRVDKMFPFSLKRSNWL